MDKDNHKNEFDGESSDSDKIDHEMGKVEGQDLADDSGEDWMPKDDRSELEDTIDFDQYDFGEEGDAEDFDEDLGEENEVEELWSKQFSDEPYLNDDGVPSRVQKKRADNKLPNNLVTIFIIIILIIIITTVAYVWYLNNRSYDRFENDQHSMEIVSNSQSVEDSIRQAEEESKKEAEEESKKAEEEESKKAEEEESRKEAEEESRQASEESESLAAEQASRDQAAAQSRAAAESVQQVQESQQSQQSQQAAGSSYTVQAGDNLYRIAQNNGVSLDALLQANGMHAGSYIKPGDTLIIPAQ